MIKQIAVNTTHMHQCTHARPATRLGGGGGPPPPPPPTPTNTPPTPRGGGGGPSEAHLIGHGNKLLCKLPK